MKINIFSASSLNGILTPKKGKSSTEIIKDYNVPRELLELQYELRRNHNAVMIGTSTVLIDNPRLNSHLDDSLRSVRISFDPYERIPKDYNFLDGTETTCIGICKCTSQEYKQYLKEKEIVVIEAGEERINLPEFFSKLEKIGIKSVLVEGGGKLNSEVVKTNLVSEVHSIIMPFVFGTEAPNFFNSKYLFKKLKLFESSGVGDYIYCRYGIEE